METLIEITWQPWQFPLYVQVQPPTEAVRNAHAQCLGWFTHSTSQREAYYFLYSRREVSGSVWHFPWVDVILVAAIQWAWVFFCIFKDIPALCLDLTKLNEIEIKNYTFRDRFFFSRIQLLLWKHLRHISHLIVLLWRNTGLEVCFYLHFQAQLKLAVQTCQIDRRLICLYPAEVLIREHLHIWPSWICTQINFPHCQIWINSYLDFLSICQSQVNVRPLSSLPCGLDNLPSSECQLLPELMLRWHLLVLSQASSSPCCTVHLPQFIQREYWLPADMIWHRWNQIWGTLVYSFVFILWCHLYFRGFSTLQALAGDVWHGGIIPPWAIKL